MSHTPAWWAEAQALWPAMDAGAIAHRLGKTRHAVRWAIDLNGCRTGRRSNAELQTTSTYQTKFGRPRNHVKTECCFIAPHQPRQVRRIIPSNDAVMAAARAFAAGEIDRAELARRLRG